MRKITITLLVLFALLPQAALANDSSAKLEAGGLRLVEEADIIMESEDLYISRKEVRVNYIFRNISKSDKRIIVAFPLPKVNVGEMIEGDVGLQSQDPVNFVDFRVMANGKPVRTRQDVRAWLGKRDITALLSRYKIPLGPFDQDYFERMGAMTQTAFEALKKAGALDPDSVRGDFIRPLWTYQVGYYWEQNFPAGKPVKLTQSYKPVIGQSMDMADTLWNKDGQSDSLRKDYCMDKPFLKGLERLMDSSASGVVNTYELGYILTTANNWRGPIGHFRLTIDKGSPRALVSLCISGIRKTGPTTFLVERRNYKPQSDLKIFFADTSYD